MLKKINLVENKKSKNKVIILKGNNIKKANITPFIEPKQDIIIQASTPVWKLIYIKNDIIIKVENPLKKEKQKIKNRVKNKNNIFKNRNPKIEILLQKNFLNKKFWISPSSNSFPLLIVQKHPVNKQIKITEKIIITVFLFKEKNLFILSKNKYLDFTIDIEID